ncbi:MAG TPA: hypothetical protein VE397_03615 [Stellaceae bacterium]|jgi:hypothetical protein|nr:hypothetical protein [Stellaceae bacterium]
MRGICALALLVALGACSGAGGWHKEGTPPATAAADYAECRHSAEVADSRDTNIDSDIMAARGQDWERLGVTQFKTNDDAASDNVREGDIVTRCMMDKGYTGG